MPYTDLNAKQAEKLIQQSNPIVIDIRDAYIYRVDHIDNAYHIDGPTMSNLIKQRKKNPSVLVYCYHGNSSRDIAEMISGFGFTQVYNLAGGWEAWKSHKEYSENNLTPLNTQFSEVHA